MNRFKEKIDLIFSGEHFETKTRSVLLSREDFSSESSLKYIIHNILLTASTRSYKYSHLFNKRGAWNKHGRGAKVAKSLNVELGINEEGGIFGKN